MKTRLKEQFKKSLKSHPVLGSIIRNIYYLKMNRINRVIHGDNNTISYKSSILSSVVFNVRGNGNKIEIKAGCILNNVAFNILGNNHTIYIGKNCLCNKGGTITIVDNNCSLIIGEESTFNGVFSIALAESNSKIEIGRDCMFGDDIDILTSDFHSIIAQKSNQRINYAKNVAIGNHVWIGSHSILLKGTSVPENSVVSTGSVVTRPFKTKGIIIGGNPSMQLMAGITWSRERIILNSNNSILR